MKFWLSRKLIVPVLLAIGLLTAIGGDVDAGASIDAVGIAYWLVVGWIEKARLRRAANRPAPQIVAQVTALSGRAGRSDGAGGAFSRLDPQTRKWLTDELQARKDTQ